MIRQTFGTCNLDLFFCDHRIRQTNALSVDLRVCLQILQDSIFGNSVNMPLDSKELSFICARSIFANIGFNSSSFALMLCELNQGKK